MEPSHRLPKISWSTTRPIVDPKTPQTTLDVLQAKNRWSLVSTWLQKEHKGEPIQFLFLKFSLVGKAFLQSCHMKIFIFKGIFVLQIHLLWEPAKGKSSPGSPRSSWLYGILAQVSLLSFVNFCFTHLLSIANLHFCRSNRPIRWSNHSWRGAVGSQPLQLNRLKRDAKD
jgi:hypothetical protein